MQGGVAVDGINQIWDVAGSKTYRAQTKNKRELLRQKEENLKIESEFDQILEKVSDSFGGVQKSATNKDLQKILIRTSTA